MTQSTKGSNSIYEDHEELPPEECVDDGELVNADRLASGKDIEVELISAIRGQAANPVVPTRLTNEDTFSFSCHKGVSCWNQCCHGADITLSPACILRLSKRLEMSPSEFLAKYTVPDYWGQTKLPVPKLKMAGEDGTTAPCPFVTEEGCSVYSDRPVTCRYYPLGRITVKMKDSDDKDEFHFLVKEEHCRGHDEPREISVDGFREEQGVGPYDDINRGWTDILMKMASWISIGGPYGKTPTEQTQRMFFMATTDVDSLRRFILETKFLDTYEIDAEAVEVIKHDDAMLLQLGYDWLKTILFNEPALPMKEQVLQAAIAKAREDMGAA